MYVYNGESIVNGSATTQANMIFNKYWVLSKSLYTIAIHTADIAISTKNEIGKIVIARIHCEKNKRRRFMVCDYIIKVQ